MYCIEESACDIVGTFGGRDIVPPCPPPYAPGKQYNIVQVCLLLTISLVFIHLLLIINTTAKANDTTDILQTFR